MTIKKFFITTTILCVFLSFWSTSALAEKKEIHWQSYENGMKMIKDQNKKGFLHFYTDWCTYCKIMNKQTFADAKVIDYINDNFIPIRVNAEKQKDIAKQYGVTRFPNNWFIGEDSKALSSQPGYIPPDMFLNMLQFLNTDSFKKMKFSEFMENQKKLENQKKNDPAGQDNS